MRFKVTVLAGLLMAACGAPAVAQQAAESNPEAPARPSPQTAGAEAPKPAARSAPREIPAEAFAAHMEALRKRAPEGFTFVVQPPFVVAGDEEAKRVKSRAAHTVKWAVDLLKKEYFDRDPDHIIDIWLFKDEASYRGHAKTLFNETPSTPFGYYSAAHRALVMNIATGGGTLVHEIVHPFMRANFAACPAWFNEGLASLYEQSAERDGRIRGLTNWRLAGLQEAIERGGLASFQALLLTTDDEFYGDDKGTNYAQARYLCYYLQEEGLLAKFYREFVRDQATDPTGYATLQRLLKADDMAAFQKRWEKFVIGLTFP
ncbi:MAG: DUF1570 domain-containing protein [Planctomycetes bacterium]|nr:DUF1570 domain-containing protein [Planctomycetota bacterium]